MRVAIGDLDKAAADATAAAIGGRGYRLDVTDEDSFTKFLADVQSDLGRIDGARQQRRNHGSDPFDEEPPKASEAMVAVNLLGVIRGVRLAAPGMRARGQGADRHHRLGGVEASRRSRLYAATKHGVPRLPDRGARRTAR